LQLYFIYYQETELQNYKEREVHDLLLLTFDFYITLFNLLIFVSTQSVIIF